MPCIDGDGFRLATPVAVSILPRASYCIYQMERCMLPKRGPQSHRDCDGKGLRGHAYDYTTKPMAKMPRSDGGGFCLVLSHRLRPAGQSACGMRPGVYLQHGQLPLSETSRLVDAHALAVDDGSRLCYSYLEPVLDSGKEFEADFRRAGQIDNLRSYT
jgi:hypothetical protein